MINRHLLRSRLKRAFKQHYPAVGGPIYRDFNTSGSKVALTHLQSGAILGEFDGNVTYTGFVPSYGLTLLKVSGDVSMQCMLSQFNCDNVAWVVDARQGRMHQSLMC